MGEFDNKEREEVFSKKVRAGKRTYFFDVKATRSGDYYLTVTESKKRLEDGVFVKHKIFLYKEDFEKFTEGLNETVDYIRERVHVGNCYVNRNIIGAVVDCHKINLFVTAHIMVRAFPPCYTQLKPMVLWGFACVNNRKKQAVLFVMANIKN